MKGFFSIRVFFPERTIFIMSSYYTQSYINAHESSLQYTDQTKQPAYRYEPTRIVPEKYEDTTCSSAPLGTYYGGFDAQQDVKTRTDCYYSFPNSYGHQNMSAGDPLVLSHGCGDVTSSSECLPWPPVVGEVAAQQKEFLAPNIGHVNDALQPAAPPHEQTTTSPIYKWMRETSCEFPI